MTWNYRGMIDKDGGHTIREVFYDEDDGTIDSFTAEPVAPYAESPEEMYEVMQMMMEGLQKPYMLETDFIPEDQEVEVVLIEPNAIH